MRAFIADEEGNIESVLVLLPLLLLFLGVLQIAVAVLSTGVASNTIQGEVSRIALINMNADPLISIASVLSPGVSLNAKIETRFVPLPGGGNIILGDLEGNQIPISPYSLGHTSFRTTGIAIDEN